MAAARYWRICGIETNGFGADLELGEIGLWDGASRVDSLATVTASIAPASGALADLSDSGSGTTVVWPGASVTAPGFFVQWDFGGTARDITKVTLGAAATSQQFPYGYALQSSSDAAAWALVDQLLGIKYPGDAQTFTAVGSDPYINSVVLLLGGNGSFADSSLAQKKVTVNGGATSSSTQSKFGGSSLYFGAGGSATCEASDSFGFGIGDFTVEGWLYMTANAVSAGSNIVDFRSSVGASPWVLNVTNSGSGNRIQTYLSTTPDQTSGTNYIPLNVWTHFAITRQIGTIRIFVGGVLSGSASNSNSLGSSNPITIGNVAGGTAQSSAFPGYIDDLRITKDVARYTADFTPAQAEFAWQRSLRSYALNQSEQTGLGAIDIGTTAVATSTIIDGMDMQDGGAGVIAGTVKEKSSPSNLPLVRKVRLHHEASGRLIREVWSDSAGNYTFASLKKGERYTVVAFDHTEAYRAVVADRVLAV